MGEEGTEGLGNHCAGPVCSRERAHHRVHDPEGGMGCIGEAVRRERAESQVHAVSGIVQDVDGGIRGSKAVEE